MPPKAQTTWIAHVDLDAFFASCEQRDHPEWQGKPVVVGAMPGGRGVVAAASYEARKFGIHSAMPISEAYRRCPAAIFVRPSMSTYRESSQRIFALLESITPAIEKASIDEAYLDISGMEKLLGTPEQIGAQIRSCIQDGTGLTASVGIGPNRLIAKLASDFDKPDGLTIVSQAQVTTFLNPLPIKVLRGAGKVTQKIFAELGINTIEQLRTYDTLTLSKHLGERAMHSFLRQARGEASAAIKQNSERKSISKERTFPEDVSDKKYLQETLHDLAREVAASARTKGLAGRVIKLKVRYPGFDTYTRQETLETSCNDERLLRDRAWQLFSRGDLPEQPVRLIGVGLSDWNSDTPTHIQQDLFGAASPAGPATTTDPKLLNTLDKITNRFGVEGVRLGMGRTKTQKKRRVE